MRRPKVADPAAQRRAGRQKSLCNASLVLASAGLLLGSVKGGMLYDRFPIGSDVPVFWDSIALPLAGIFIGLALVVWAANDSRPARCGLQPVCIAALSAVAFIVWCAQSAWLSPALRSAFSVLGTMGAGVCLAFVVAAGSRKPGYLAVAIVAVVAAGTLLGGIGVREYLTQWRAGDPSWRVFAGFAVPNFLAGLLVMTVPVTAALLVGLRERLATVSVGLALALQMLALLLTQSRLGLLALAAASVLLAAGALRSGALQGVARKRALWMAGLVIITGLIGARPVIARLRASRDQSYSARFRVLTWKGAQGMAKAHMLRGTGIGSFDATYPPYAVVGYTQHAHNSFIQIAAETGAPGLGFLLLALAAVFTAGVRTLRPSDREDWPLGSESLLLTGALAGIGGAVTHNVFDSDLYVPANALMLGAVCGIAVGLVGRYGHSKGRGLPVPAFVWRAGVLAAGVILVGSGGLVALSRTQAIAAASALTNGDLVGSEQAYRSAAALDWLEPEYRLALAQVCAAMNRTADARREHERAIALARTGKTLYRYGRYLAALGLPAEAIPWYERAQVADPRHLRNLMALADAYGSAGRPSDALKVYRNMTELYRGPVGQVRAVPEVVDWEYGIAFSGLAEAALDAEQYVDAERYLSQAEAVLKELWRTRDQLLVKFRVSPESMLEASARYEWVLAQRARVLEQMGQAEKAAEVQASLSRLRKERDAGQE